MCMRACSMLAACRSGKPYLGCCTQGAVSSRFALFNITTKGHVSLDLNTFVCMGDVPTWYPRDLHLELFRIGCRSRAVAQKQHGLQLLPAPADFDNIRTAVHLVYRPIVGTVTLVRFSI
jgi:hypothetical protein